jgi:hypothetical protein
MVATGVSAEDGRRAADVTILSADVAANGGEVPEARAGRRVAGGVMVRGRAAAHADGGTPALGGSAVARLMAALVAVKAKLSGAAEVRMSAETAEEARLI